MAYFPVRDTKGNFEYNLEPPVTEPYKKVNFLKLEDIQKDISVWENIVESSEVDPKCLQKKEIYIDSRGNVLPCCWVGSDVLEEPLDITLAIHELRNKLVDNSKDYFKEFRSLNLNSMSLDDILNTKAWNMFSDPKIKPWVCVKNCTK
jgi:hypothetical protein